MLRKYYEAGYNVIPVVWKRPAPGVLDHTRWATERMPESLIDEYEKLECTGTGIITGPSSGVIGLDLDTEDKAFHELVPRSICTKVGANGNTRFFRYAIGIDKKRTFVRKNGEKFEVLANGHMSVLWRAIHPDTRKPYYAPPGCKTLLEVGIDELPVISPEEIDYLAAKFLGNETADPQERDYRTVLFHDHNKCVVCKRPMVRCPHGAHDRIKGMLASFIAQKKTKEKAIEEICVYDITKHRPIGYLSDSSRSDFKGSAYKTAESLYYNIFETINTERMKNGLPPELPSDPLIISVGPGKEPPQRIEPEEQFPAVGGILGKFKDAILSISRSNQNDMALGAALAITGTLCANRFKKNGSPVYTTSYILNVASTGAGKGAANDFINELFGFSGLGSKEHYRLLGISNYSSDAAIIHRLKSQRTRLDVVDEFGQVFKGLSMKGDRKAAVGDCLKALFSAKFSFNGHYTKTSEEEGKCITPSVSLLGSIQPETLINNTSPEMMFDGFMGRFLYFLENDSPEWTGNHLKGGLNRDLLDFLVSESLRIFPANPLIEREAGVLISSQNMMHFTRTDLFNATDYEPYVIELDREHFKVVNECRKDGRMSEAASINRSIEHTEKIAHIICICNAERIVTRGHLELAHSIVRISNKKVFSLLKQSSATKEQRGVDRIVEAVKKNGGLIRRNIALRNSHLGKREFKDVVDTAIELGLLIECESSEVEQNGKRTALLKIP